MSQDNVILMTTQQTTASSGLNLSLAKMGTIGQSLVGLAVTGTVILASVAVVIMISFGIGFKPPIPRPDHIAVYKSERSTTIYPLKNDMDPKGATLTLSKVSQPLYGRAQISSDQRSVVYYPNGVFSGQDSFQYTVSNDKLSATSHVNITVLNHAPECANFTVSISRNTWNNRIELLSLKQNGRSIEDIDADDLVIEHVDESSHGSDITFDNKTLSYSPASHMTADMESVRYWISDRNETCNATITFVLRNDAPVAQQDTYRIPKHTVQLLDILSNDYDVNGDEIQITHVGSGRGSIRLVQNDHNRTVIRYQCLLSTTDPYYDSFDYTISDSRGSESQSYAVIEVFNTAPISFNKTVTVEKNSLDNRILLPISDSDSFDVLTASVSGQPNHGSGTLLQAKESKEILFADDTWVTVARNIYYLLYTPNKNSEHDDIVEFTVTDSYDFSTGFIHVIVHNNAPVAMNDTTDCHRNRHVDINVLENDIDMDGDVIELMFADDDTITTTNGGHVTKLSSTTLRYTPVTGFVGTDSFVYAIRDVVQVQSKSVSSSATVHVNVVNDAPVARDDSATVTKASAVLLSVLDNDSDPNDDTLTIVSVSEPSAGSSKIDITNGTHISFTSDTRIGAIQFTYVIADDLGLNSTATVFVTIVNSAPVAVDDVYETVWKHSITIDPLENDVDTPGDTLKISSFTTPSHGQLAAIGSELIYRPHDDFVGTDSFTYYVTDGYDISANPATVTIHVRNNAPVANTDNTTVHWRTPDGIDIDVLGNDFDMDGDTLDLVRIVQVPSCAQQVDVSLVVRGRKLLRFYPSSQIGLCSFGYVLSDGNREVEGVVDATITNERPVPAHDTFMIHWRTNSATLDVLSNDIDDDGDVLEISSATPLEPSSIGSIALVNQKTVVNFLMNDPPVLGTCHFNYTLSDGAQTSLSHATATIIVTNEHVPETKPIESRVHWRTLDSVGFVELSVYDSAYDADGDSLTLSVTPASNGISSIHHTTIGSPSRIRFNNTESWKKGDSSFTYTLSDTMAHSTSTVDIVVYNTVPVTGSISMDLRPEQLSVVAKDISIDVLAVSSDADPEDLPHLHIVDVSPLGEVTGSATIVNNGKRIIYRPDLTQPGTDHFTFVISDGLDTATGNMTLSMQYVAVSPKNKFYQRHWRDIQLGVKFNLTEDLGDVSLTSVSHAPSVGHSVIVQQDMRSILFTPIPHFVGIVEFRVSYTDGFTTDDISVTVSITNTKPVAKAIKVSKHWRTLVDAQYGGFDLLSECRDDDSDPLFLSSATMTQGAGSLILSDDLHVTYVSPEQVVTTGLASLSPVQFSYTINDTVQCDSALVDLLITNVPPVPVAHTYSVHWRILESGHTVDLTAGATDEDGDPVTLYSVGTVSPPGYPVSISSTSDNGQILVTGSAQNLVGKSFTFLYSVTDGASVSQQVVTVHVTNTLPTAFPIQTSLHWREQTVLTVTEPATDGDDITITSVTSNLQKENLGDRVQFSGHTLLYTPPQQLGNEILVYTVFDGIQSVQGTANITIYNHEPTVASYDTSAHWTVQSFDFPVLDSASDLDTLDRDHLTVLNTFAGLRGDQVTVSDDGIITVRPSSESRVLGNVSLTYFVSDGMDMTPGTIVIKLTNTAPVAPDKTITIPRVFGQYSYRLTGPHNSLMVDPAQDADGDALTLEIVSAEGEKASTRTDDFDVNVFISEYFEGTKLVRFVYHDGLTKSNTGVATVHFTNSAPVCHNQSLSLMKGEKKSVSVTCTDANNDPLTISATTYPNLALEGNTFTFKAPSVLGTHVIPFVATDDVRASGGAYLNIRVSSRLPVASDSVWNIMARRDNNVHSFNYLEASGATDPDGDTLRFSIVSHTCALASSISITGDIITMTRPYTFSSGTCDILVASIDNDGDSVTNTVRVTMTTQGLVGKGNSITVTSLEGTYFTLSNSDIMENEQDLLGGTLVFTQFYVDSADCASNTDSGFCGNQQPVSSSPGQWKFSQYSPDCQTQRFRYQFRSVQDPSQLGYAILNVRFLGCTCKKPIDIVFVLDGSTSVGEDQFKKMRTFVSDIVSPLDVGSGSTHIQVGLVLFNADIQQSHPLSSNKATVLDRIKNLSYKGGMTNIRSAMLRAEQYLLNGRSEASKIIITVFDGTPNQPCSCSQCTSAPEISSQARCNSYRFPLRSCSDCVDDSPLKCNPCSDVLHETKRINDRKPGNPLGYWRVMSIGVGPNLKTPSAQQLVRDLSYDKNLSFSVDWNQLSTIVSTIQAQSCDLVDTSTPTQVYVESTEINIYCGQIVGVGMVAGSAMNRYHRFLWTNHLNDALSFPDNQFNPSHTRSGLFQITNCGAFGTKIPSYVASNRGFNPPISFSLWNLQTQRYMATNGFFGGHVYAKSETPGSIQYFLSGVGTKTVNSVRTLSPLRVAAVSPSQSEYTKYLTITSSSSTDSVTPPDAELAAGNDDTRLFMMAVSYNNIAYRDGLPPADQFPTPITDLDKSGAL